MTGYYTFRVGEDEDENTEFNEAIATKTFGDIAPVPAEDCPACPKAEAGRRGKAGKGRGTSCGPTETLIEVDLYLDYWPEETSWTVTKNIQYEGNTYTSIKPVMKGGTYPDNDDYYYELVQESACVPEGQYQFTIYVSDNHGPYYLLLSAVVFALFYCITCPPSPCLACFVLLRTLATYIQSLLLSAHPLLYHMKSF